MLEQLFLQHISQAFSNFQRYQQTATDFSTESDFAEEDSNLSLVDNAELEETLAIGSMSRRRSADCSEHLYALNHRLTALRGGSKMNESSNPVAPAVFAEAIRVTGSRAGFTAIPAKPEGKTACRQEPPIESSPPIQADLRRVVGTLQVCPKNYKTP